MLSLSMIGYLGNDAVLKEVNGKKVINFSVAHTEKFKNNEGVTVEKTQWVECALWDGDKIAPYLTKGTLVHMIGSPSTDVYKNKDGDHVASMRLRVQKLDLLVSTKKPDSKPENANSTENKETENAPGPTAAPVDDLPF